MKYYEIWFYYNENDTDSTDWENEYSFYIKVKNEIKTKEELISHLKREFPITTEFTERMHYIPERDYEYLTKFFEISGEEFTRDCGISA